jgi:hypothetical protein
MLRRVATPGVFLGLFLASAVAAGSSGAVEPSGTAIRVDPAVNATGTGGKRLLELEGAVFVGDVIVASPVGLAQIKFIDDTRIVIGPNSRLKIDTFVFNPNNTAKKVTISALRGTFRFISGKSPHEAYTIRTPTMTIGVRGTILDISVGNKDSSLVFQQGGGRACDSGGHCTTISNRCEVWVAPLNGPIGQASGIDRQRRLAVNFPFLNDQSRLAMDFQVHNAGCNPADARIFGDPNDSLDHQERHSVEVSSPPEPPAAAEPPAEPEHKHHEHHDREHHEHGHHEHGHHERGPHEGGSHEDGPDA